VDDRALAIRAQMSEMSSNLKTAGTEFAARSRDTTTTRRLPCWFRANDGREGIL